MDFSKNIANIPQLAFTHGGRFHADDVFSSALLKLLRPDIRIYRGFSVPQNFSGIAYDIGNGKFDHHEKTSPRRENGVPYAAFGLLWREFGHFFLAEDDAQRFDEKFVQPLDLDDNIGSGNTLAGLISAFNPSWDDEDKNQDEAFFEAVEIAENLLLHKLESLAAVARGRQAVQKELEKMQDNIVVLEVYVPWKPVLIPSLAQFVVFPSMRGGISLQCIPKDYNGKTGYKVPFPEEWHGKPAQELANLTGVAGFQFCHASGFMATVETVEQAKQLCQLAKQHQNNQLKKV